MKFNTVSRRHFLQGAGGFLLSLPFLPSLLPQASAGATTMPRRFAAFWDPLGYYTRQYWPQQDPSTRFADDVFLADLRGQAGDISSVFSAARFGSVRDKMLLLRGLDALCQQGHNDTIALSASFGDHITIDNILARSNKVYPVTPKLRSLNLRPYPSKEKDGYSGVSYDYSGSGISRVPDYSDERDAFARLFAGGTPTGSQEDPVRAQALAGNSVKVVDRVMEDFATIRNSRQIAASDRSNLDFFFSLLSDLENRLKSTPGTTPMQSNSCSAPVLAASGVGGGTWDLKLAYKNHLDLMVAAFACGLTNVATFSMAHNPFVDWDNWHTQISHNPDEAGDPAKIAVEANVKGWMADQVAYLVNQLNAIPEGTGTMLDNTLVFWGGEIANGDQHLTESMQAALFGGAGGALKTGYYIDYRQNPRSSDWNYGPDYQLNGRPYNQLLVTICQAMGLAPADYEQNGNAGIGSYTPRGPDNGIDLNGVYAKYLDLGTRRSGLPFIAG